MGKKNFYDEHHNYKGYMDEDGSIYDEYRNYKGRVEDDGSYYDEYRNYKGKTDKDGNMYDEYRNYKGHIDKDGNCYDEYRNYRGSRKEEEDGGCFLTTACTEFKGLQDNCRELTTLRQFRDNYMKTNYIKEVENYYVIAPSIVSKINVLSYEEKRNEYSNIYEVVNKCVSLIENNENETAYEEYKSMVNNLEAKYL